MTKKRWISLLLMLALAFVFVACAPTPPAEEPAEEETEAPAEEEEATEAPAEEEPAAEETEAPAEEPAEEPADDSVAVFIFTQEFDTLNPLYTNMWFSTITHQIWNHWAWEFDEENTPFPVLLTELPSEDNGGISEGGRVITMTLRDDLTWSDGEPLTAEDFVFTYQMNVDPGNAVASVYPYDLLESVEAPDDTTVVMTFAEPFAGWLGVLWHGLLPEHILGPVYEAEGTIDSAEWNLFPNVGSGPYVLESWESGSFARFVRNENYWGEAPAIGEIFIQFVPDDASQVAALQAGDGDLGTFISYADIPTLEDAGLEVITVNSGYNEGFYFYLHPDNAHPAMLDERVRQAIAYGTDRFTLVNDLLLGLTVPASTMWDNTPYQDPTIEPYPYDPDMAMELLDEAGWTDSNGDGTRDKDGVELVLTYGTTNREIRQDTQAVIQQQLAEIGIGVELLSYDSDIYFSSYGEGGPAALGELDMFEYSTSTQFPDPDTADYRCSEIPSDESPDGTNWAALCDEELEALFARQATETDPADREATFHEISRMIYDKVYWLGLWQDPDVWVVNSTISNAEISGVTPFFNIMEWELTE